MAKILSPIERFAMYEAQGSLCAWCNMPMSYEEATEDHAIPHTRGGTDTADNIELFHQTCNSKKGKKDVGDPGKWPHARSWDVQSVLDEVERRSQHRGSGERQRAGDAIRWAESIGLHVVPGGVNQAGCLNFILELPASRTIVMQLWGSSVLQLLFRHILGLTSAGAGSPLITLVSQIARDIPELGSRRGFQKALRQPGGSSPEAELTLLIPDRAWGAFTTAWTDAINDIRANYMLDA